MQVHLSLCRAPPAGAGGLTAGPPGLRRGGGALAWASGQGLGIGEPSLPPGGRPRKVMGTGARCRETWPRQGRDVQSIFEDSRVDRLQEWVGW